MDVKLQVGKAAVATCGQSPPTTARPKFASRFNLGFFLSSCRSIASCRLLPVQSTLLAVPADIPATPAAMHMLGPASARAPQTNSEDFHSTIYNTLQRRTPKSGSIAVYRE